MAKLDKNTNYFASMTDMMVGILFVFIIMIAYFAFQIQQSESVPKEIHDSVVAQRNDALEEIESLKAQIESLEQLIQELTQKLTDQANIVESQKLRISQLEDEKESLLAKIAELQALIEQLRLNPLQRFIERSSQVRDEIVERIVAELTNLGIDAKSVKRGVLTISGKGLFASGRSDLESVPTALATVDSISDTILSEIECFLPPDQISVFTDCTSRRVFFDSIYIEGHTDNGRVLGTLVDGSRNNLELSARRATNTYQRMVEKNSELKLVLNPAGEQALSVAAYGEQRWIQSNDTDAGQEANRRIDIRFVMYTPNSLEELERLISETE